MKTVKPRTRRVSTIFYTSEKVPEGVDIELEFTPVDYFDTLVAETETGIKIGYVIRDECSSNPLEDCDGFGTIHHHPRSNYGSRDSEYYNVLGLDSYGEPVVDEDKLQAMWHDKVMALPLELFTLPEDEAWDGHQETLRQELAEETAGDYTMTQQCQHAWHQQGISTDGMGELVQRLENTDFWRCEEAEKQCRVPPNPDVIMLDLYDHSGQIWSISGTGMNCWWDTSRHESLWVPDEALLEEVEGKPPEDRETHLRKACKQALKMYSAWSSGEVYEVVVQEHDFDGAQISCDYKAYCYGSEDAKKELKEAMK